ncbi:MAG: hypothetical protein Tsb0021_09810 [Chlamydiales bacterium]
MGNENVVISLDGYLDSDQISKATEKIKDAKTNVVIRISSESGDLKSVLNFARALYAFKQQSKKEITVYILNQALGPSAIIPFLADKILISPFISWGDIPYGSTDKMPTNILRNQVSGFVTETHPEAPLLNLMAKAMVDANLTIVEQDGKWMLTTEPKSQEQIISPEGEALVVNQRQLEKLTLVDGVLSPADFNKTFMEGQTTEAQKAPKDSLTITKPELIESLQKHITFKEEGPNKIGRIVIDDRKTGINESTWIYVKSAIDSYLKSENKPIFIILELNTPGGQVFSAQKISDALKELDTQHGIPVVTFINNWAISAGAMLAYSTRYISITKDASMGAAEPVMQTAEGMETASEKVNSALRADFANRASFFGRNPLIAEAMVDKDIILVLRNNKVVKLDSEDQIRKEGPNPDTIISAKGKLLTLNANEMMEYGVADIKLESKRLESITTQEKEKGVWPASKEALFTYSFFSEIPNTVIVTYQMDWKTMFLALLANPVVASFLFLGLMIGFYLEINTPGFGVPGTIAFICLILIVLSSMALEAINWLEIILIGIGILLIAIDLFLIPTFGLMGAVGVIFLLAGILGLMIPGIENIDYDFDTNTFNAAGQYVLNRLTWLGISFVLGIVIIGLLARYVMPKVAIFNPFVLTGKEEDASEGYFAGEKPEDMPQPGAKGKALSALRPGGKVMIGEKVYDAISNGDFIPADMSIIVHHSEGSTVFVEKES